MSGSGSYTQSSGGEGFSKTRSLTFEARTLRDIAGAGASVIALTSYAGVNSVEQDGASGDYYETASGVTLSHSVAGSIVSTVSGDSGPTLITDPVNSNYWMQVIAHVNDSVENDAYTLAFAGLAALSSSWGVDD